MKHVQVFASQAFSYVQDANGRIRYCDKQKVHAVPELVAEKAIEVEAALDLGAPEGKSASDNAREAAKQRAATVRSGKPIKKQRQVYWPLGDVMGLQQTGS
jgi:hypothetical protein